jgi:hypothetical protein
MGGTGATAMLPLLLGRFCPTDPARQLYLLQRTILVSFCTPVKMTVSCVWGRGRYEERDPYFGVSLAFDTEGLLEDVRSAYQHIQVRQCRFAVAVYTVLTIASPRCAKRGRLGRFC